MFDLQKHSELLSDYVLMAPYGPHYMQATQMAGTVKMNWYNFAFEQGYKTHLIKEPYLEMPVAVILFDDDLKQSPINSDNVIYSGKEFQIVKTPYELKDGLDEYGNVDPSIYFYFAERSP
jgi:methenyltetrahydromethanopterin cyclohydrolase